MSEWLWSVFHGYIRIIILLITTGFIIVIQDWGSFVSFQLSSQLTQQLLHMLEHRLVIASQLTVQLGKEGRGKK